MNLHRMWHKLVRPAIKKADTGPLVKVYQDLCHEEPLTVYAETCTERGIDPHQEREDAVYNIIHGPALGPHQESLKEGS